MNRPGQPPQRPPSLGPNPGLPGSFRGGPYPQYGMPPRNVNVLPGGFLPGLQPRTSSQQQQQQSMVPSPSPAFMQQQQRNQNNFPFGGIGQQPQQQQQQLPPPTPLQQHTQQQQQQQQQSNGASTGLPPHLTQSATTTSLTGTAPSVSSASEVGLDPNDFPALGSSAPTNTTHNGSASVAASYASQAGTGVPPPAVGGTGATGGGGTGNGSSNQPRDFTPDDFPALGGQTQAQGSSNPEHSHPPPPGLNGFQHTADHPQQQHRQNLLGSIHQPGTPGMLNIGAQARNVHPGFQQQSEAEKQRNNYALKLNQATHVAWNSPNANPGTQSQLASAFTSMTGTTASTTTATLAQTNGTHNQNSQSSSQNPSSNLQQQNQPQSLNHSHLNPPPGVPPPTSSFVQPSQHAPGTIANAATANNNNVNSGSTPAVGAPYMANGMGAPTPQEPHNHPQTPAQQVLMSAADRWGLLGLLAMIKSAGSEVDGGLSSVGTDLGTMGLDVGYTGNLYATFITPWADQSAAHTVEPDYHLPGCYNVQPPPPGPSKAAAFSDETLFFMFYSSPRDALQEVAAQELYNRNWRYHKELRLWITKETGMLTSQKVQGGEQGTYTFWDPDNWQKERKDMTVLYADLEEKNIPAFMSGPGLVLAHTVQPLNQTLGQGQTQQQQVQQQRGTFQMGMTGL